MNTWARGVFLVDGFGKPIQGSIQSGFILLRPNVEEAARLSKLSGELGIFAAATCVEQTITSYEGMMQQAVALLAEAAEQMGIKMPSAIFDIDAETLRAIDPGPALRVVK